MGNRIKMTDDLRKIAFAKYTCSELVLFNLAVKGVESLKLDRSPTSSIQSQALAVYKENFRQRRVSSRDAYRKQLTMVVNHCRLHLTRKHGHKPVGTYDPYISAFLSRCADYQVKR